MKNTNNLSEKIEIIHREKIVDNRGWFLKPITGKEDNLPSYTGEIYLVSSSNGASRGGHYHKKATEWFTIFEGKSILRLYDIFTKEKLEIKINNLNPLTIVVPPFVAHRFDSVGKDSFTLLEPYFFTSFCMSSLVIIPYHPVCLQGLLFSQGCGLLRH